MFSVDLHSLFSLSDPVRSSNVKVVEILPLLLFVKANIPVHIAHSELVVHFCGVKGSKATQEIAYSGKVAVIIFLSLLAVHTTMLTIFMNYIMAWSCSSNANLPLTTPEHYQGNKRKQRKSLIHDIHRCPLACVSPSITFQNYIRRQS